MHNNNTNIQQLTILQHNVRCWRTQKHNLCNIYQSIDPDIILINSHGLKDDNRIKIFNYNIHQQNKSGEANDGIAIAVRRNIKYKIIDNYTEEFMSVKIRTSLGEVQIGTTYLPPRRNYLPAQDLMNMINSDCPTYILGDFNARHRIFGNNDRNYVGENLNTIIQSGKLIHIGPNFHTYIGARSTSNPDKIFSNNRAFFNYYSSSGPLTGSDHLPIVFKISTSPIQIPARPRLLMGRANWEEYQNDLRNHQVPDLQGKLPHEIDREITKLQQVIKDSVSNNIPTVTVKTLPHNKMSHTIRTLQTRYNNMHNYISQVGPSIALMRGIRNIQNEIRDECLKAHQQTWNDLIDNIDNTTIAKDFWRAINKLLGTNNQPTHYVKDHNGRKLYENKDIAEAYRREWKNIFRISPDENELFDNDHEEMIINWVNQNIERTIPYNIIDKSRIQQSGMEEITEGELLHNLRSFKERAPGFTGITRNMLLNLPANCIQGILEIFNSTLSAGYFPTEFKRAKMVFIPKEGKDNTQVINNRPISLLEVLGKTLEKSLNSRLVKHIVARQKFNPRQHGFTEGRGTQTALAIISETIANKKAEGQQVNLVLRDVKKAFDKVWHMGLKYKILQLDLPTPMEKILCNYLDNRSATIQIGEYIGEPIQLESGVPQGGCLSPTLYNLYTADMPGPTPYSEHLMFADDVTQIIAYPGKSPNFMASHTKTAINNINNYEKKWKIQTNANKFKIIPITKWKTSPIIINDRIIPYSNEGTVLGMTITRTGYKTMITKKSNKAKADLLKIKRFGKLSIKNKKKIYMALVRSAMLYPPVPQHAIKKTNIRKYQVIQNKALRYMYNVQYPDIIRNDILHERAELKPINIVLHEQASSIWEKIDRMDIGNIEEWMESDQENPVRNHEHFWIPRSREKALGPVPAPIY